MKKKLIKENFKTGPSSVIFAKKLITNEKLKKLQNIVILEKSSKTNFETDKNIQIFENDDNIKIVEKTRVSRLSELLKISTFFKIMRIWCLLTKG